jgi:hypothetical protein
MEEISTIYCSDNGRPTHNLRTLTGLIVIQELFNLQDHQVVERLKSNKYYQYALDIMRPTDATVRISYNIYYNFIHKLIQNGIIDTILNMVTTSLAEKFKVDKSF